MSEVSSSRIRVLVLALETNRTAVCSARVDRIERRLVENALIGLLLFSRAIPFGRRVRLQAPVLVIALIRLPC